MFNQPQYYAQPESEATQQEQQSYPLASIFERAVAFALDILGLFVVIYIAGYIFITKMGLFSSENYWILLVIFYLLFILYCGIFQSGGRQTLGKFLVGLKVVDRQTGEGLSFKKALFRGLGYFINIFTMFIGFGLAFLNKRRLTLEDYIAGSEVISVREKTPNEYIAIAALGTMIIGGIIFYVYYMFFMAPSAYQKELVDNARNQLNQLAYLEEVHKQHFGRYTSDLLRLALISGDPVQLQRDIQKNLRRRGFSIGINPDGFQISAIAKDREETIVTVNNKKE